MPSGWCYPDKKLGVGADIIGIFRVLFLSICSWALFWVMLASTANGSYRWCPGGYGLVVVKLTVALSSWSSYSHYSISFLRVPRSCLIFSSSAASFLMLSYTVLDPLLPFIFPSADCLRTATFCSYLSNISANYTSVGSSRFIDSVGLKSFCLRILSSFSMSIMV